MAFAHPAELSRHDLYHIWITAPSLTDRFDPFSFQHRMAAYRHLIDATNHNGLFGPDNRRNPLWGLTFQHQWQFRSGRLGTDSLTDGRIDPDAAWGYGNYTLNVLPWLGAAQAGLVPALELAAPPVASRFRYASGGGSEPLHVPEEFRAGIADWRRYFELVAANKQDTDQESLRFALWKAHKTCLDIVATRIAHIDAAPYPATELTFLRGWCRMVDYLWAAAWPTDFDFMITYGLDVLPEQILLNNNGIQTPMPDKISRNVRNILALARLPEWRHRIHLLVWKRIMRNPAARSEVVTLLDALFNPNSGNAAARRRMRSYLLRRGRRNITPTPATAPREQ